MQRLNHSGRKYITVLMVFLLSLSVSFLYQPDLANADTAALVETQWLADNLNNKDIRIVHVSGLAEDAQQKFDSSHIPGAVFLTVGDLMTAIGDGSTAPDNAAFAKLAGGMGINNDTHIVIAGMDGTNPFTTSAFWLFKYHGYKKISYLNGGIKKWTAENRAMTADATTVKEATYACGADSSIFTAADYVLANVKKPGVVIVDVRSPDEFSGKANPMENKRIGHIPGSVNLEFAASNLDPDGTFKPVDDLKAIYTSKGVTSDKEIILYCEGGVRASNTHFVLKYLLGYPNVKVYVGSMGEWTNRLDPEKYPLVQ